MKFQNFRGFTLIELLIVVAIIAILAAIAVPNFLEAQVRAKVSRGKSDMRSIVTALESYHIDNNRYPVPIDAHFAQSAPGTSSFFHARMPSTLTTPIAYMTSLPNDPFVDHRSTFDNASYPASTGVGKRFTFFNSPWYEEEFAAYRNMGFENWVGTWLMYGYGPDGTPFHGDKATFMPYDPTNGTTSLGNVIRSQKNTDGIAPHPVSNDYIWP